MPSQQTLDLVQRLQVGTLELFDLDTFEKLNMEELVHELGAMYPIRFLERSRRDKLEIGLAHKQTSSKRWPAKMLHNGLLLTGEAHRMTTMAVMTYLRIKPSRERPEQFELATGAGFSVYHDPDGWRIKLIHERKVTLTAKSLTERGWLLRNGME